jgi:hypothetical protein
MIRVACFKRSLQQQYGEYVSEVIQTDSWKSASGESSRQERTDAGGKRWPTDNSKRNSASGADGISRLYGCGKMGKNRRLTD